MSERSQLQLVDGEAAAEKEEGPSFEEAIQRLGHIVEELERGDLPLEASLGLFEEGIKLARLSQQRLDIADKRIDELLGVGPDGEAMTRKFDVRGDGEG